MQTPAHERTERWLDGHAGTEPTTGSRPDPVALAEAHLTLVSQVVHQVTARFPRHVDRDDLRGAGAAGLVEAAHRYDADVGVPFARYASLRIRGSVLDASRSRDWAPRRLRRELRVLDGATSSLEHRLRRAPSDAEVAAELGVDEEVVRQRRAAEVRATLLALDGPDRESADPTAPLADRLAEPDPAWLPEAAAERAELITTLQIAIGQLPEALRRVVVEHHLEGRLLRDIAGDLGCTEARVSQLRFEAIHALRAYLGTLYAEVETVPTTAPGKLARARFVERATTARRDAFRSPRTGSSP